MSTRSLVPVLFLAACLVDANVHGQSRQSPPYVPAANVDEAMKRIDELGGIVRRVAPKDDALEVDFRNSTVTDSHLQYLLSLKTVAVVRLRETGITDAGLLHLGKLTNLKRLHLEKTAVTDAGMKHLSGLKELELLNLFGTEVSDAGLQHLKAITRLKSLFVFQTKTSAAGIAMIQRALPGIQVVPDPKQERQNAEAAWKIARSALDEAGKKLAAANKDAEELAPKAVQLKKELDEANKRTADAKNKADDAKKIADQSNNRANELKSQAESAQKATLRNPDDLALKKLADAKRLGAEEAMQVALEARKRFDEAQLTLKSAQAAMQTTQQQSNRAANARKLADEAQKHLEHYRQLEVNTRARLDELRAGTS